MPTQPPTASLMGIPSELRIAIFEYLLPWKAIKYNCKFKPANHDQSSRNTLNVFKDMTVEGSNRRQFSYSGDSYQREEPWDSTYFVIMRINQQCNIEAVSILYQRTLLLGMISDSDDCETYDTHQTILDIERVSALVKREPYVWSWNHLWVPRFSALKTLELVISPRDTPGYWYAIQSSMTLFIDQHLGKPPKNLIIKIYDMARTTFNPVTRPSLHFGRMHAWSPISATFEDYMETLHIFQHVAPKAKSCQIFVPYWMERRFQSTALKQAWDISPGVKVRFMPLGSWPNPTEYVFTLTTGMRLPKSAYLPPVNGLRRSDRDRAWSILAWYPKKEAPEENLDESRVREGYFFLANLAKGAQ